MEKLIAEEEDHTTNILKKDNLKFANTWNKTNVKIAVELKKTTKEEAD